MPAARAQTKPAANSSLKAVPAAKPASAAKPAAVITKSAALEPAAVASAASALPALVTDKMEQPAVNTNALKVRAEANPLTKRLTVRTDASGPTRVEINAADGSPVITRDLINSTEVAVLDVSQLPPGAYIVQCTSGERRGMKRVMLGQ